MGGGRRRYGEDYEEEQTVVSLRMPGVYVQQVCHQRHHHFLIHSLASHQL